MASIQSYKTAHEHIEVYNYFTSFVYNSEPANGYLNVLVRILVVEEGIAILLFRSKLEPSYPHTNPHPIARFFKWRNQCCIWTKFTWIWNEKTMMQELIALFPTIYLLVRNFKTSKDFWDFLAESYERQSKRKKAELCRKVLKIINGKKTNYI